MEIVIRTLIDITNTNIRRINQGTQKEVDQYRNFSTLIQCIGMRGLVTYHHDPISEVVNIDNMKFGIRYKGEQRVWTFKIYPDQGDCYTVGDDKIALLAQDLDKIPIILNLDETINSEQAVLELGDLLFRNTVVEYLPI